jgi:hypothetical protein
VPHGSSTSAGGGSRFGDLLRQAVQGAAQQYWGGDGGTSEGHYMEEGYTSCSADNSPSWALHSQPGSPGFGRWPDHASISNELRNLQVRCIEYSTDTVVLQWTHATMITAACIHDTGN